MKPNSWSIHHSLPFLPFWKTDPTLSHPQHPRGESTKTERKNNQKSIPDRQQASSPLATATETAGELTRLINSKLFSRGRSIHLVIVEQTLKSPSGGDLRLVPPEVICQAIPQLEELMCESNTTSTALHQLLREMVRITNYAPVTATSTPGLAPAWPHLSRKNPELNTAAEEPSVDKDDFPDTVIDPIVPGPVNHGDKRPIVGLLW